MAVAFTVLAFFLTVGVYLDRVVSNSYKLRVSRILKQPLGRRGIHGLVMRALRFIKSGIFDKIFAPNIFGLVFFVRTFLYSITICLAFLFFYQAQGHKVFTINREAWNVYGVASLFVLFLSTLSIDYLSAVQTGYFFRLATRARRASELIILAVADVIVTINIFIFLFAAGLAGSMLIIAMEPINSQLEAIYQPESVDSEINWRQYYVRQLGINSRSLRDSPVLTRENYRGTAYASASKDKVYGYPGVMPVFSNKPVERVIVFEALRSFIQSSSSFSSDSIRIPPEAPSDSSNAKERLMASGTRKLALSMIDVPYMYSVSYKESYRVQTNFWGIAKFHLLAAEFDELFAEMLLEKRASRGDSGSAAAYCVTTKSQISLPNLSTLPRCDHWVIFSTHPEFSISYALLTTHRPSTIPTSAFFMSSFGITMIIYIPAILFMFGHLVYALVRKFARNRKLNVDEYPFSCMAGPVGFVLGAAIAIWHL